MSASKLCSLVAFTVILCTGCKHRQAPLPQLAQAPRLQTGKGTLSSPKTTQPQEKSDSPLASPLPPASPQSVPLPPPPPPKKVRHKVKTPPSKPADTNQANSGSSVTSAPQGGSSGAQPSTPPVHTQQVAAGAGTASPIGQLTAGDSAVGERTKHETADLIGETKQGLSGIKRSLSTDEKVTATQIQTFLKQAQQALENGDTDGAHTLATKAKLLLDELTKP